MRPALPGVLYENLALLTEHCMEYTLACIWCYYYDDGLEVQNEHDVCTLINVGSVSELYSCRNNVSICGPLTLRQERTMTSLFLRH